MIKTQISATIKPTNTDFVSLRRMLEAGTDIIRIPFWPRDEQTMLANIDEIKRYNSDTKSNVQILLDVPGNKVRFGTFAQDPVVFDPNKKYTLFFGETSNDSNALPIDREAFFKACQIGDVLVCGDGDAILEVDDKTECFLSVFPRYKGILYSRKGVCVSNRDLNLDKKNLPLMEHCANIMSEKNLDWMALSFASSKDDIAVARDMLRKTRLARIMAKIESPSGLRNAEEIIDASDGIMVARGDLGAYVDISKLGVYQKQLVRMCKQRQKYCMVSTGVFTGLMDKPQPRPAEVLDLTNIVLDGADAVQFCEETAHNHDPAYVIKMAQRIIDEASSSQ